MLEVLARMPSDKELLLTFLESFYRLYILVIHYNKFQ